MYGYVSTGEVQEEIGMLLVVDSRVIDDATLKLRDIQKIVPDEEVKTIEMVIRDLNNESVSIDQSIARGMREIKESY